MDTHRTVAGELAESFEDLREAMLMKLEANGIRADDSPDIFEDLMDFEVKASVKGDCALYLHARPLTAAERAARRPNNRVEMMKDMARNGEVMH